MLTTLAFFDFGSHLSAGLVALVWQAPRSRMGGGSVTGMASQYYLQREGQDAGPFGFRDLVALARNGELAESDQVRYSWTNEWKRADSLVGLFYMARRTLEPPAEADPLLAPLAADESSVHAEIVEEVAISAFDDRPGWMKRLLFVGGRKKAPPEVPILDAHAAELPTAAADYSPTSQLIPVFHS